ncbi:uncharacterized protein VP01_7033g1 [Puccinia sorghi]|uniref:Retrotransposon gag domain-containing protein n=1 Tax=Puccinia sorghi TaxID=27349 RepID=A0A0L6UDR8_9BASI|nr:uncharacterized protein VP01_7033g1 [Puccinia sorghi]
MDALNTCLDKMMFGQQNQDPTPPQIVPAPPPTSSPNSMVLANPQTFNRTCGAAAKSFVGQILLHAVTYPDQFPTIQQSGFCRLIYDRLRSNLVKVFNTEDKFLDKFRCSLFDHNCQHHAEVALQSPRQTGTVSAYTQEFNSHSSTFGWADTPLMSLYHHGLKKNFQLAVVMSNIKFTSLRTCRQWP